MSKDITSRYGNYKYLCGSCVHFESDKYTTYCERKNAVVAKNYSCRYYIDDSNKLKEQK